jgi:hypothetical protein
MTDKRQQGGQGNTQEPPEQWTTGDERMTGAQRSTLKTLSEEAHEPFDDTLSKAAASLRIDELQKATGRGQGAGRSAPTDTAAAAGSTATGTLSGSQRPASRGGAPAQVDDRTTGSRMRVNAPDGPTTNTELEYPKAARPRPMPRVAT